MSTGKSPDSSRNNFWKWGNPSQSFHLNDYPKFKAFLEQRWQRPLSDNFTPPDVSAQLSPSRCSVSDFVTLFPQLNTSQFSNAAEARLKYSFGKSYHDIIRIFSGNLPAVADFVLFPESEADLLHVLQQAGNHGIAIIPFSGGSNVTGAFDGQGNHALQCRLNLQRMNKMIALDAQSHTATFEAGIFGPALEKKLNENGFTLGHFPQSFEYSTLGGWLATRSGGQESGQYGKIEDMALNIRAVTPAGVFSAVDFPRHAAGIDAFRLFIGSEGTLGVISQAKVRIHKLPGSYRWVTGLFKTFEEGMAAVASMVQAGIHPGIMRLSDALETQLFSTMRNTEPGALKKLAGDFIKSRLKSKGFTAPCILMMRFAIKNKADACLPPAAEKALRTSGGYLLPASTAGNWEEHRFTLPYLRDTLIEHRIMIDTFETIAYWKDTASLYAAVKKSLQQTNFYEAGGLLFCHVSHVYETGACLYFSMIAPMEKGNETAQWLRYKNAVTDALTRAGGAVSHHHGIGNDHRKWYLQSVSEQEKELLKAVKRHLDPRGIMNPGKLFDE